MVLGTPRRAGKGDGRATKLDAGRAVARKAAHAGLEREDSDPEQIRAARSDFSTGRPAAWFHYTPTVSDPLKFFLFGGKSAFGAAAIAHARPRDVAGMVTGLPK